MAASLVVIAGPDEGKVFTLADNAKLTVGRGDAAQIRLADDTVSRAHCIIEYSGGKAILKDNASTTGVRVNGQKIGCRIARRTRATSQGLTAEPVDSSSDFAAQ
jgi:pSer/pThr/pTyr-binding forkhead associated (FHA) protein